MSLTEASKLIALILRHKPETIGITLDGHGWASVDQLIEGIARRRPFTMADLTRIVATDEKGRYSFNEDKTRIRANYGHSVPVDADLRPTRPPEFLYHGTGEKYLSSILREGILPKSRLYVHLSDDPETAENVGARHDKPAVLRVAAGKMDRDGCIFFRSVNGVWLTKKVPADFIERL